MEDLDLPPPPQPWLESHVFPDASKLIGVTLSKLQSAEKEINDERMGKLQKPRPDSPVPTPSSFTSPSRRASFSSTISEAIVTAAKKKKKKKPKKKKKSKAEEKLQFKIDTNKALVALTTTQLQAFVASQSKESLIHSLKNIRFIRSKYQVPFPSREPSEAGDDATDDEIVFNEDETLVNESRSSSTRDSQSSIGTDIDDSTLAARSDAYNSLCGTDKFVNKKAAQGVQIAGEVHEYYHTLPYDTDAFAHHYDLHDKFGIERPKATHEHLENILMPYYGHYILSNGDRVRPKKTMKQEKGKTVDDEETTADASNLVDFGDPETGNLSDYYGLLLIEDQPQEYGSNILPPGDKLGIRGDSKEMKIPTFDLSVLAAQLDPDDSDSDTELEDEADKNPNILYPPRSLNPVQAMIIHSTYRWGCHRTVETMYILLYDFLFGKEHSRWVKIKPHEPRLRVPQHSQLNQYMLGKIMYATADQQWWDEVHAEYNAKGEKITQTARIISQKHRITAFKKLMQKTVENYLGQRFYNLIHNEDIEHGGEILKPGEW